MNTSEAERGCFEMTFGEIRRYIPACGASAEDIQALLEKYSSLPKKHYDAFLTWLAYE
jgi:hypothetical protein